MPNLVLFSSGLVIGNGRVFYLYIYVSQIKFKKYNFLQCSSKAASVLTCLYLFKFTFALQTRSTPNTNDFVFGC